MLSFFPLWANAQQAEMPINDFQKRFVKGKSNQTENIQTNLYKPGRSLNYFWNVFDWQYTGNSTMTYTPVGNLSVKIDSGFSYRKTTYTYDNNQRETEKLEQNFNSLTMLWENDRREVNIFEGQGELLENRSEQWSGNDWAIVYGEKHIRSYSPQNLLLEDLQKTWDVMDSAWVNEYLETEFLYDNQSRLQSYVSKGWNDTIWENEEKSIWSYGPDNKPSQVILQEWNGSSFVDSTRIIDISWNYWSGNLSQSEPAQYTMQKLIGGNWVNFMRFTITGDQNGSQTFLNEIFLDGNWVPSGRTRLLIDDQLNPVVNISEIYNPVSLSFDTAFCMSFQNTYDTQGRILEQVVSYWDADLHILEPMSRQVFSQHQVFTGMLSFESARLGLSPNPVRSGVPFRLDASSGNLSIQDMQGRTIYSGKIELQGQISTAGMQPGVYQVLLKNAQGLVSRSRLLVE